jgi:radical SAM superfamily enzyme YgiQ (UPF0313 family)
MTATRSSDAMPPLVFSILAGQTPPEIERVLFDERLEPIPEDDPTDLMAMSVETYTARRAYQIADRYRYKGIPVVMGGYHPTFVPQEALEHADAVVIGDAEGVWDQIVRDAREGGLRRIYQRGGYSQLGGVRFDRSIFQGKPYVNIHPVQYGRGCRYACDFCSIHAFYGTNLRQRPVGEVVEEIAALDSKHIFIVDDNIFVDIPKAEAFFTALIPLKIRWSCQVSIDVVNHARLMKLMEKSGCAVALIGFESLDERNLRQMKKGWNLRCGDYAVSIKKIQDHGIMIYGTFVIGYDGDDQKVFDKNVDFALRSNFYLANFNPLTPMPGAKLYNRLLSEGRLIYDRWWLNKNYRYGQATFHPRGMTADELTEGCFRARRQFYQFGSMCRRAWNTGTKRPDFNHQSFFWAANLISRREILRKQGLPLGEHANAGKSLRDGGTRG